MYYIIIFNFCFIYYRIYCKLMKQIINKIYYIFLLSIDKRNFLFNTIIRNKILCFFKYFIYLKFFIIGFYNSFELLCFFINIL
jgi:hypothetical protein